MFVRASAARLCCFVTRDDVYCCRVWLIVHLMTARWHNCIWQPCADRQIYAVTDNSFHFTLFCKLYIRLEKAKWFGETMQNIEFDFPAVSPYVWLWRMMRYCFATVLLTVLGAVRVLWRRHLYTASKHCQEMWHQNSSVSTSWFQLNDAKSICFKLGIVFLWWSCPYSHALVLNLMRVSNVGDFFLAATKWLPALMQKVLHWDGLCHVIIPCTCFLVRWNLVATAFTR